MGMRVGSTVKGLVAGLVLAGVCLALGACGVRGSLDSPDKASHPKSAESAGTQTGSAAPPKKHEDFILDPLLR
jgi:predicted small lipoprotein YifL